MHLSKNNPTPPFYEALTNYFTEQSITSFTPKIVRDAVVAIRSAKLPDPKIVNNSGSFFANPIVDQAAR